MEDDNRLFHWLIFGVLVVGILLFALPARSHSWYEPECCSGVDCAEITSVSFIQPIEAAGLPQMVVTTKIGTTIVPRDARWRQSKDSQFHACIKPYDKNPATNFLCIYAPPSM